MKSILDFEEFQKLNEAAAPISKIEGVDVLTTKEGEDADVQYKPNMPIVEIEDGGKKITFIIAEGNKIPGRIDFLSAEGIDIANKKLKGVIVRPDSGTDYNVLSRDPKDTKNNAYKILVHLASVLNGKPVNGSFVKGEEAYTKALKFLLGLKKQKGALLKNNPNFVAFFKGLEDGAKVEPIRQRSMGDYAKYDNGTHVKSIEKAMKELGLLKA